MTNNTAADFNIIHTYTTFTNIRRAAESFRLALAIERGYTSTLHTTPCGVVVVASDGRAVAFRRP